jgi:hypothetical protein
MKWLRLLTILIIVIIVTSITSTITLSNVYSAYKGNVEGTGFVVQELDGSGTTRFDIDDLGNIYFAVNDSSKKGITVYNNAGMYLYTLPIRAGGAICVKIDDANNILVYNVKGNEILQYNSMGIETNTIDDSDYSLRNSFSWLSSDNVRERNGIKYINLNGNIIKSENGTETVVFTIPTWQKWHRAASTIMVLSIVALFLRIAISLWIKAYKERYGR